MVHDNSALTVSQDVATKVEEDAKRRLLATKRLSLVVDLDQTIIHATVDPTVAEWQADRNNPNYESLKDVKSFQLIDDGPGMKGCWYYIKLRPGLREFLQNISKLYELHIYTMGTRAYARSITNIVDPEQKIFGDRILSRDESGSLTAKNLERLFPVDTKMVVIIDDRGDVWKWTNNLIKVAPYDFFVGIGDINSSFLPKRQELKSAPKTGPQPKVEAPNVTEKETKPKVNGSQQATATATAQQTVSDGDSKEISALEQLVTMGGGDNPVLLQEQANEQEETIAHQVEERPLLQKQKALDAEDDAADSLAAENGESSSEESQDSAGKRHHLFEDNDTELQHLEERLQQVHESFFEEYDRRRTQSLGGRVTALRGERIHHKDKGIDLRIVPDIKTILPQIKRPVLQGVVLIFSAVIPLEADTQNADISLWAKSFGAAVAQRFSQRTTHLVAGKNRTSKVREATRYPKVKIVTLQWLLDSLNSWKHQDEEAYLVPVHPDDRRELIGSDHSPSKGLNGSLADSDPLSSSEEDNSITMSDDEGGDSGPQILTDEVEGADEEIALSSGLNELSPIGYDEEQRIAIHGELKDFLGSDDEESESDSDASNSAMQLFPSEPARKRKRSGESDDDTAAPADDGTSAGVHDTAGSPLSRRIKLSNQRSTSLKTVSTAPLPSGSSEMPESALFPTRGDGDGDGDGDGNDDEDDIGDDGGVDHESDTTEDDENTAVRDPAVDDAEDDEDAFEKEMRAAFEEGDVSGSDTKMQEEG